MTQPRRTLSTIRQSTFVPAHTSLGWLLVTEASPVPVPAAGWLFMFALVGLIAKTQLSRQYNLHCHEIAQPKNWGQMKVFTMSASADLRN